jgi:hypothetical protein
VAVPLHPDTGNNLGAFFLCRCQEVDSCAENHAAYLGLGRHAAGIPPRAAQTAEPCEEGRGPDRSGVGPSPTTHPRWLCPLETQVCAVSSNLMPPD